MSPEPKTLTIKTILQQLAGHDEDSIDVRLHRDIYSELSIARAASDATLLRHEVINDSECDAVVIRLLPAPDRRIKLGRFLRALLAEAVAESAHHR